VLYCLLEASLLETLINPSCIDCIASLLSRARAIAPFVCWGFVGVGFGLLTVGLLPVVMLGLRVVFSLVTTRMMAWALQAFSPRLVGLASGFYLGSHGAAAVGVMTAATE
jgi:hypothetical protein